MHVLDTISNILGNKKNGFIFTYCDVRVIDGFIRFTSNMCAVARRERQDVVFITCL